MSRVSIYNLRRSHIKEYIEILNKIMAKQELDKYDAIALLAIATGRRISEILMIDSNDVDFEKRVISFKLLKKKKETHIAIEIPEEIFRKIEPHLRNLPFNVDRVTAYKYIKKRYGYNPHAFRHFFALVCLETLRDIERCRRLLGHENYTLIAKYADTIGLDLKSPLADIKLGRSDGETNINSI